MKEKVRFWGLDVHAETIAVAVAEPDGEVRSLGTIPNRAELREPLRAARTADWAASITSHKPTYRY
jgi:transposase